MFFTPFAFIQQPFAVSVVTSSLQGYYFGGSFLYYQNGSTEYFRVFDSSGSLSSTFNAIGAFSIYPATLAVQSDGKILAGGSFTTYSGSGARGIARINTNGTIDTGSSWNSGAGFSSVASLAVQSDGKILAGGGFTTYSGSGATRIARINTNGTLDTGSSWNSGAGFNSNVTSLAVQLDGKILVGGGFTTYSGSGATRIARLNVSGTIDTGSSWNSGAGFNSSVASLAVQSDGKILAGGSFTTYSGSGANRIARINTNGTIDTGSSWNSGTGFNSTVNSLAVQSDGKILAGGGFTTYSGSTANYLVRLNTSGTIDTTFNTGAGLNNSIRNLAIQSDGKIVCIGGFTAYSGSAVNNIFRLNSNGTIDNTFSNTRGIGWVSMAGTLAVLADNSIAVAADNTSDTVRYLTFSDTTGNPTPSSSIRLTGFSTQGPTFMEPTTVSGAQKYLIGGNFTYYSGSLTNRIVRINTDNTIDSAFNIGSGFSSNVSTAVIQPDGKAVVGGDYTSYSGSGATRIARINTNGTMDTGSTWNSGAGFNGSVNKLALQSDGKILAIGLFSTYSGSGANRIARLNISGTLDTGSSWNSGAGFNSSTMNSLLIQSDGKILVGGGFTTYSGSGATRIARLNVSGTIDTGSTWNSGAGFNNSVNTVVTQSDGKILVGGNFTTYSGSGATRIARLNVSGTIDTGSTWNSGTGFNSDVNSLAVQSDGKILVGGNFTTYSGSTVGRIARLSISGTLDTSFVPISGGFSNNVSIILPIYS